jgi:hypothetical protein
LISATFSVNTQLLVRTIATVQFFDGPHDPLTFFGPVKGLGAKMNVTEASPTGGLGLGEVVHQWEE